MTVEQRHELRKELKKLRYAVEFFAPLYPAKRVDPFLKHLKKLQTVFGDLNDAATVRAMLTGADTPASDDPTAQRAVGWVIGASQARAEFTWAGAKALWKNLEKPAPSGSDLAGSGLRRAQEALGPRNQAAGRRCRRIAAPQTELAVSEKGIASPFATSVRFLPSRFGPVERAVRALDQ